MSLCLALLAREKNKADSLQLFSSHCKKDLRRLHKLAYRHLTGSFSFCQIIIKHFHSVKFTMQISEPQANHTNIWEI